MKKINFLIIVLFFGFRALGQQAPHSEVVNSIMPQGAVKLTKNQLLEYVNNNYKRSQVPADKENIYQLDGLLISFWDLSVNPGFARSLEISQAEMRGYIGRNSENVINFSKIITLNNIRFLVFEYQQQDEVFLWFRSDFNKNNKDISGVIQFKKPDEDKAQLALQSFLKSVHFKE